MVGLWLDATIILGVVIINGLLGFIQEGKAEKALDSIRNMLSADARTLRDGEMRMVSAEDLVPGDIVLLESGDRIPADVRLVEVKNLRTEEAALTGESVPIDKTTDATAENHRLVHEVEVDSGDAPDLFRSSCKNYSAIG
jgi:P-type E1-E2 ATPase